MIDYDPNNPYHYHSNGLKVVVNPEDWELYKDLPIFENVRQAVEEELAAHPGPEYVPDPDMLRLFHTVGSGLMHGQQNYRNLINLFPQGWSISENGIIQDLNGIPYVQRGFNGGKRFFANYDKPTNVTLYQGKPIERTETFYPVNIPMVEKQPDKVDRYVDVNPTIDLYIKDNTKTINHNGKTEYEPYGHYEDWIYPIRNGYYTQNPGKITRKLNDVKDKITRKDTSKNMTWDDETEYQKEIFGSSLEKNNSVFTKDNNGNIYYEYNPVNKTFKIKKVPYEKDKIKFTFSKKKFTEQIRSRNDRFNPTLYTIPFTGKPDPLDIKGEYLIKKVNPKLYNEAFDENGRSKQNAYVNLHQTIDDLNDSNKYTDDLNRYDAGSTYSVPSSMNPTSHKGIPIGFGQYKYDKNLGYEFDLGLRKIIDNKVTRGTDKIFNTILRPFENYDESMSPYFYTDRIPVDRNVVIEGYNKKTSPGWTETVTPTREEALQKARVLLKSGGKLISKYLQGNPIKSPLSPAEDIITPDAKDIPAASYVAYNLWNLGYTGVLNRNLVRKEKLLKRNGIKPIARKSQY